MYSLGLLDISHPDSLEFETNSNMSPMIDLIRFL